MKACDECGKKETDDNDVEVYNGEDGLEFPFELETFDIEGFSWDKHLDLCKTCAKKGLIEELQDVIKKYQGGKK